MGDTLKETNRPKNVAEWISDHPNSTFLARFIAWVLFAGGLPFAFIAWRFKIFGKISTVQISGWGIIGIVILAIVIITILKYIKLAFSRRYSFWGQCLAGFCKVIIPLCALLVIIDSIKQNIDLFFQVMCIVTVCEAIAVPLNPLPKWAWEMQKDIAESERKEYADYLLDGWFSRKKNEQ